MGFYGTCRVEKRARLFLESWWAVFKPWTRQHAESGAARKAQSGSVAHCIHEHGRLDDGSSMVLQKICR